MQVPFERKSQVNEEVERLVGLGATKHDKLEEAGEYCVIMLDSEGNEFCALIVHIAISVFESPIIARRLFVFAFYP
ncbi:MAG: hypothetical protein JRN20_11605 [Nitrososphaerota archaeon]|nr:hypothetical protein [Nitrososphaerota archaeon]MDG6923201.1 hypothetical protein [Nitrososphaerota archaeon]